MAEEEKDSPAVDKFIEEANGDGGHDPFVWTEEDEAQAREESGMDEEEDGDFDPATVDAALAEVVVEADTDDPAQLVRQAIVAELDAVNLYTRMAARVDDVETKTVLLDIADEERVHIAELHVLLVRLDPAQADAQVEGAKEVQDIQAKE